jgi:hypothetical protein
MNPFCTRLSRLLAGLGVVSLLSCFLAAPAPAQVFTNTMTYTRFAGPPENVKRVDVTYDAGAATLSLGPRIPIASTPGADGILFAPDGFLIVGGQGNAVHRVDPSDGSFTTVTAGGVASFHVMLDPRGNKVWTAGNLGALAEIPLFPTFANGIPRPLSGDDLLITHLGFVGSRVYYTASTPIGFGNFGTIDMNTFVTTRLYTNVPWSHGMAFDCFTGHLMAFGSNQVAQIDPASGAVVSLLDLAPFGFQFDQGTADGVGHLYIASNTGHMLFVDLKNTSLVGSPLNFVAAPFLDSFLDDIAPDCGLGSPPTHPRTIGYWRNHEEKWPVSSLTLGCQTYTKAECLAILRMSTGNGGRADASLILAKQLIAAKLNVANQSFQWPTILPVIDQADALLCTFSGRLPYNVRTSSASGQQMVNLAAQLDTYNNSAASSDN